MEHVVTLGVPAESRHVRLVRMTAAGVAADAELDVDDVEDVRIAVSELFALLVDDEDPDVQVEIVYRTNRDGVVIEGMRPAGDGDAGDLPELDDLARGILEVIVDGHSFSAQAGARRFSFEKRRSPR